MAGQQDRLPGAARLQLTNGIALLRPEEQVFEAMDGWRNQQLARNLSFSTIEKRQGRLRAFVAHAQAWVVATMLGYTHDHAARTATTAGTTWSRYAPGDHTRLQDRRTGDS